MLDGIFGGSQLLGIDIGQNAVKVSRLTKKGRNDFVLQGFGFTLLSESAIMDDEINDSSEIIQAISQTCKMNKFSVKNACIGLSGSSCVVKTMQVPDGSKEDMEDNALWEAEQFVPFGVDNAEMSLHVTDNIIEGSREVIMAAAKISTVDQYQSIINSSGLKIKTIDLQVLALVNIFEHSYADNLAEYRKGTLIIDLGAQTTKVIIYKNGVPLMVKSMLVGGVNATEEIQKEIGLDFNNAEDLKKSNEDGKAYPDEILTSIKQVVDSIVRRITDAVSFYNSTASKDRIYHCFVTGGNMKLPGIIEGLIDQLDLSIETLDPLRRIKVKTQLSESLGNYITYCGAVSLGLSLRNFD